MILQAFDDGYRAGRNDFPLRRTIMLSTDAVYDRWYAAGYSKAQADMATADCERGTHQP